MSARLCASSKSGGVHIDQQQATAVVEELPGGEAVLVGGGVAVGAGEDQPALVPALGEQVVEVRPP